MKTHHKTHNHSNQKLSENKNEYSKYSRNHFVVLTLFLIIASIAIVFVTSSPSFSANRLDLTGAATQVAQEFTFVVASDAPVGFNHLSYEPHITTAVNSWTSLQPEIVIFNGDMIAGGDRTQTSDTVTQISEQNYPNVVENMWQNFKTTILDKNQNTLFIPVPGDQDIGLKHPQILSQQYEDFWKQHQPSVATSGNFPFTYSFDHKNAHFIVLNTVGASLTQKQIDWLENDLANTKQEHRFVFSYVPLAKYCSESFCASLSQDQAQTLSNIMQKYNVKIFFSGNNQVYYQGRFNGVNTISTGALGTTFKLINHNQEQKQQPSYTVVEVKGSQILPYAMTGNTQATFNLPLATSLLPQSIPPYESYTSLTTQTNTILEQSLIAKQTHTSSSGNKQMDQWDQLILQECNNDKTCFATVKAFMYVESGGNPKAISATGCAGLMQFCIGTAESDKFFFGGTDQLTKCCVSESGESSSCANERAALKKDQWTYQCTEQNDNRLNPELSIKSGKKYIMEIILPKYENIFVSYLRYNAGVGAANKLRDTLAAQGKEPTLDNVLDVLVQLDLAPNKKNGRSAAMIKLAKMYPVYLGQTSYSSTLPSGTYSTLVGSSNLEQVSLPTQVTYQITPNTKVATTYNSAVYEKLREYLRWFVQTTQSCLSTGESLKSCTTNSITKINQEAYFKNNVGTLQVCSEDPAQQYFYDLVEEINGCLTMQSTSNQSTVQCAIPITPAQGLFSETHLITFTPQNNGITIELQTKDKKLSNDYYHKFKQTIPRKTLTVFNKEQQKTQISDVQIALTPQGDYFEYTDKEDHTVTLKQIIIKQDDNSLSFASPREVNRGEISAPYYNHVQTATQSSIALCLQSTTHIRAKPLEYRFAFKFNLDKTHNKTFDEPVPTFVDESTQDELSFEQLKLTLAQKSIAIISNNVQLTQQDQGYIFSLKEQLPSTTITEFLITQPTTQIKDTTFANEIITQSFDYIIFDLTHQNFCEDANQILSDITVMANQAQAAKSNIILITALNAQCEPTTQSFNSQLTQQNTQTKIITQEVDATALATQIIKALAPKPIIEHSVALSCNSVFAVGTSSVARAEQSSGFITKLRELEPQITFKSLGFAGKSSKHVRDMFSSSILPSIKDDTDCLIVWAGLNDVGNPKNVKTQLATIYDLAHQNNLKVIAIELQPYYQKDQNPSAYQKTNEVNSWITTQADVDASVAIYAELNDPQDPGKMKSEYINGNDFIHPNGKAHTLIAQQISDLISPATS